MPSQIANSVDIGAKFLRLQATRLQTLVLDFRSSKRANVAVTFGLAALPIISAVGCLSDYSYANMIKTKLQAAADAATLATISNNSPIIATAKSMSGSGTISGGATYAQNFFSADTTSISGASTTGSATKSGMTITATLNYTYSVPTTFMKVIGYSTINVTGSSQASVSLPVYISFYLMLDVSGSMSFPSTTAEQNKLIAVNPDNLGDYSGGCQFACHFTSQGACGQSTQGPTPATGHSYSGYVPNPSPGGYCQGFTISRLGTTPTSFSSGTTNTTNGSHVNWTNTPVSTCATAGTTSCIQLRADAVGYAVTALLTQANTTETNNGLSNQFEVGLYPFIRNLCTASAGSSSSCSVGLTTSLTGSTITTFAQQLANLLDTGVNTTLGSGGTHFENALNSMNSFISTVGTGGSASSYLPYVFIVTDGSQDYQTQSGGSWSSQNWTSNASVPYQNSATVIPPNTEQRTDYCGAMKSRGITVAVLYIPYGTIVDPNSGFANNEDGYANNNIANIPTALQNCASSGFFYTASTPAAIQNALVQMFEQAVVSAHVSQ